ncbi:dihydrofolate reductase [Flavisolibacter ginsenosidimutans]|uniref:Dihydrofolate reductase n=1 Tax=Flavisolibacter ginsenosidimutans TaxID=661481 RepID=A0A5B8UI43_9BACT|nr:dihydrofolate reductase [Flavisolibacter ginsenosidimutans]QEC56193.1 dihydrofolate reductase [Flavisolibacter ginsenosidimutans]
MLISLLVAASENNVIGKDNKLPWHLPDDLKYFKNLTWAMPILMGRKTFDSIGKPLPGRKSIVITRNNDWGHEGVDVVHSIEAAVEKAKEYGAKEIFVIGGAEIFKTSLPNANRIYLTRIHHPFDGDVFFPVINEKEWTLVSKRYCEKDAKNAYDHTYQVWERKM